MMASLLPSNQDWSEVSTGFLFARMPGSGFIGF